MKASFGFKNTGIKLTGDDVPVQVDSSTPVNLPFNPLKTETTISHDQISEESRALENQHPASSISWGDGNVDEALQAQSTLIGNLSDSWTDTTEALQKVSDGGEIENSLYDWFKGVYTSLVDKSVKSWLNGIVTYLKSLAERVGLLEDSSYLDTFKISVGHLNQHDYFNAAKTTGTGVTSGTITANRLLMYPISVSDNITIDLIACRVAVSYAGGEMRLAIYEGNPFYPYTLLWQSEGISQETLGVIQISLNLTLYKNKCYWLCVIANNSNAKLYSFQVYQVAPLKGNDAISTSSHSILFADYPYGVLPSKLEGLQMYAQYNYVPNISLRKA